jgi:hypothetical protein
MVASATYVTTSSLQKAIDAEKKRSHRDDFATSTRNVNMSDDDTPKAHPDIGNNAHSRALERNPTTPKATRYSTPSFSSFYVSEMGNWNEQTARR